MASLTPLLLVLMAAAASAQLAALGGNRPSSGQWHHAGNWSQHRGNWTGRQPHQWAAGGRPIRPLHQRPRPGPPSLANPAPQLSADQPAFEPQAAWQSPPFAPPPPSQSEQSSDSQQPADSSMSILPFPMPIRSLPPFPLSQSGTNENQAMPAPQMSSDMLTIFSAAHQADLPPPADDQPLFHTQVMPADLDVAAQNTAIVPADYPLPSASVPSSFFAHGGDGRVRLQLPSRSNLAQAVAASQGQSGVAVVHLKPRDGPSSSPLAAAPSWQSGQGSPAVVHLQARPQQPPAALQQNDGQEGQPPSIKLPARPSPSAAHPASSPSAPQLSVVHLNPRQGSPSSPRAPAALPSIKLPGRLTAKFPAAGLHPQDSAPSHAGHEQGQLHVVPLKPRPQAPARGDAPLRKPDSPPTSSADGSGQPLQAVHLAARGQQWMQNGRPADLG